MKTVAHFPSDRLARYRTRKNLIVPWRSNKTIYIKKEITRWWIFPVGREWILVANGSGQREKRASQTRQQDGFLLDDIFSDNNVFSSFSPHYTAALGNIYLWRLPISYVSFRLVWLFPPVSTERDLRDTKKKKRKEIGKSLPSSYDFRRRPFRSRVRRVSSTSSHSRGFISGLKAVGTKGHPMILTRL